MAYWARLQEAARASIGRPPSAGDPSAYTDPAPQRGATPVEEEALELDRYMQQQSQHVHTHEHRHFPQSQAPRMVGGRLPGVRLEHPPAVVVVGPGGGGPAPAGGRPPTPPPTLTGASPGVTVAPPLGAPPHVEDEPLSRAAVLGDINVFANIHTMLVQADKLDRNPLWSWLGTVAVNCGWPMTALTDNMQDIMAIVGDQSALEHSIQDILRTGGPNVQAYIDKLLTATRSKLGAAGAAPAPMLADVETFTKQLEDTMAFLRAADPDFFSSTDEKQAMYVVDLMERYDTLLEWRKVWSPLNRIRLAPPVHGALDSVCAEADLSDDQRDAIIMAGANRSATAAEKRAKKVHVLLAQAVGLRLRLSGAKPQMSAIVRNPRTGQASEIISGIPLHQDIRSTAKYDSTVNTLYQLVHGVTPGAAYGSGGIVYGSMAPGTVSLAMADAYASSSFLAPPRRVTTGRPRA